MSEQAEKFLAQWEIEHVKMVARSDREYEAGRLALRCLEDAARAGISRQDLEAAAEANLIGNMPEALADAEFRQMYRDQVASQEDSGEISSSTAPLVEACVSSRQPLSL